MTQGSKETFKEYAQRWRDTAAQVSPRIEEKEMVGRLSISSIMRGWSEVLPRTSRRWSVWVYNWKKESEKDVWLKLKLPQWNQGIRE